MEIQLKGSQTEKNLLKAFSRESQGRNYYEMFAIKAKEDGYEQIAEIFSLTAEQERSHAKTFFRYLKGGEVEVTYHFPAVEISSTLDNIRAAISYENEIWTTLYPSFAKVAESEGFDRIAVAFRMIANAEVTHHKRFATLLRRLENDRVFEDDETQRWHCRKCGYTHIGSQAPASCPACNHPHGYFEREAENL